MFQVCIVSSQNDVDSLVDKFNKETDADLRISLSYEIAKHTYKSNPENCFVS